MNTHRFSTILRELIKKLRRRGSSIELEHIDDLHRLYDTAELHQTREYIYGVKCGLQMSKQFIRSNKDFDVLCSDYIRAQFVAEYLVSALIVFVYGDAEEGVYETYLEYAQQMLNKIEGES